MNDLAGYQHAGNCLNFKLHPGDSYKSVIIMTTHMLITDGYIFPHKITALNTRHNLVVLRSLLCVGAAQLHIHQAADWVTLDLAGTKPLTELQ